MKEPRQIEHLTAQVPKEMLDDLRALARQNERSVSAELRVALSAHLKQNVEAAA